MAHDPRLTGNACRCGRCHAYFNSPSAFDAHRKGDSFGRFCLTTKEMREWGMELDDKGRWTPPRKIPTNTP